MEESVYPERFHTARRFVHPGPSERAFAMEPDATMPFIAGANRLQLEALLREILGPSGPVRLTEGFESSPLFGSDPL